MAILVNFAAAQVTAVLDSIVCQIAYQRLKFDAINNLLYEKFGYTCGI